MAEITHDRLRSLIEYSPETGEFRWRAHVRRVGGRVAGTVSQGYINISVDGRLYRAHRLAWLYMYGSMPATEIDHVNRIGTDNRIENIRPANRTLNMANTGCRSNSGSGIKGVQRRGERWIAHIRHKGERIHLGCYDDKDSAAAAYVQAATRLFGGYARAA